MSESNSNNGPPAFVFGFLIGAILMAFIMLFAGGKLVNDVSLGVWHQAVERGYGTLTVDKEGCPVFTWKEPEPTP